MNSRHSYPGEFPDEGWPIEHLSADQLEKGAKILEKIETSLKHKNSKDDLIDLSNEYYTVVPHKFSRGHPPPIINSMDLLSQEKHVLQDTLSQQQS
jgi:poly [ADP-ribose] polymerase